MKKNMGNADKTIRIILAILFSILYFTNTISGTAGIILLILGGVFLFTGLINFCPLYLPFGINACKNK